MKITIDTKEDSHEDIRNVIRILHHLIGDNPTTNQPNAFEDSSPAIGNESQTDNPNTFGNFFNNQETDAPEKTEEPKKDDTLDIIEY